MTQDEEIRRGHEAERLLAHPLLSSAFSEIESVIVDELRVVPVGADKKQRDLIVTLQLLGNLKKLIQQHIQTGQLAEISKRESLGQRILRRMA